MFLVGGSIIGHGIPVLHHFAEHLAQLVQNVGTIGGILSFVAPILFDAIVGIVAGGLTVGVYTVVTKLMGKKH